MSEWDGVREQILALGPRQRNPRLQKLLRRSVGPVAPLLADPLTETEVASAERQFGITFPTDYRHFLLDAGAGGLGPGYGVAVLARQEGGVWTWPEWQESEPSAGSLLARPFPSDEERTRLTDQLDRFRNEAIAAGPLDDPGSHPAVVAFRAAEDELYPAMTAGAVQLSHEGCGYFTWLVVTGEERGNLWFDARCSDGPLAPLRHQRRSRTRFAEWYLEWLDEITKGTR